MANSLTDTIYHALLAGLGTRGASVGGLIADVRDVTEEYARVTGRFHLRAIAGDIAAAVESKLREANANHPADRPGA